MTEKNFMNFIPVLSDKITLADNEKGTKSIIVMRKGLLAKIVIFMFNAPKALTLDLDKLGSRVVELCDGEKTVGKISGIISTEFGSNAEPLLPRMISFIKVLYRNRYIRFRELN